MRHFATLVFVIGIVRGTAAADRGAVATEHRLAAEAGASILAEGGTVVDAAIATAASVCVVHPSSCGIGGGGFALVRLTDGTTAALDFREVAPAAATAERYRDDPSRSRTGGLAVAVPGEVAGWVALHARHGKLPLSTILAPAVRLARDGIALADAPHTRREIEHQAAMLRADDGLRATYLGPGGAAPAPDARLVQTDLASTLEAIGRDGAAAFYEGTRARAIVDTVAARGGVLTTDDLARYAPRWRTPLEGTFKGRRVLTFPPPGSGAIVLTVLGMLEGDDVRRGHGDWLHLLGGALGQGFVDRARWYGDVEVPVAALLAPARLRTLRAAIPADGIATPTAELPNDAGTANLAVVDRDGNAVALTTTINTGFGAGIMVPGTGIVLNNEMDDFASAPGRANVFGLTGGNANEIAPGKRPQSSMSPTIVLDGSRVELAVGGSGGPLIISGVAQVILGVVGAGETLRAAVDAPRIHDQGRPPMLLAETGIAADARARLAAIGHKVVDLPAAAAVSAVGIARDGAIVAAGDRRKDGGEAVAAGR